MKLTTSSSTGHLAMFQTVDRRAAEADQVADLLGEPAGEDHGDASRWQAA